MLKDYYDFKPVLSFFLSTLYYSDKNKKQDSWYTDSQYTVKPYHDKNVKDKTKVREVFKNNIKFACMPHKELSSLFDFNIVSGVKSYVPPKHPSPHGTSSIRVTHESLKERYDSSGTSWDGFKSWII